MISEDLKGPTFWYCSLLFEGEHVLWFWSTVNKNRLASEYERLWDCFNCSLHHLFPILCLACFSNASKSNGSDVEGKGLNSSSISAFPSENKSKLNYQSNPSAFNFKLVYTSFPSCIWYSLTVFFYPISFLVLSYISLAIVWMRVCVI